MPQNRYSYANVLASRTKTATTRPTTAIAQSPPQDSESRGQDRNLVDNVSRRQTNGSASNEKRRTLNDNNPLVSTKPEGIELNQHQQDLSNQGRKGPSGVARRKLTKKQAVNSVKTDPTNRQRKLSVSPPFIPVALFRSRSITQLSPTASSSRSKTTQVTQIWNPLTITGESSASVSPIRSTDNPKQRPWRPLLPPGEAEYHEPIRASHSLTSELAIPESPATWLFGKLPSSKADPSETARTSSSIDGHVSETSNPLQRTASAIRRDAALTSNPPLAFASRPNDPSGSFPRRKPRPTSLPLYISNSMIYPGSPMLEELSPVHSCITDRRRGSSSSYDFIPTRAPASLPRPNTPPFPPVVAGPELESSNRPTTPSSIGNRTFPTTRQSSSSYSLTGVPRPPSLNSSNELPFQIPKRSSSLRLSSYKQASAGEANGSKSGSSPHRHPPLSLSNVRNHSRLHTPSLPSLPQSPLESPTLDPVEKKRAVLDSAPAVERDMNGTFNHTSTIPDFDINDDDDDDYIESQSTLSSIDSFPTNDDITSGRTITGTATVVSVSRHRAGPSIDTAVTTTGTDLSSLDLDSDLDFESSLVPNINQKYNQYQSYSNTASKSPSASPRAQPTVLVAVPELESLSSLHGIHKAHTSHNSHNQDHSYTNTDLEADLTSDLESDSERYAEPNSIGQIQIAPPITNENENQDLEKDEAEPPPIRRRRNRFGDPFAAVSNPARTTNLPSNSGVNNRSATSNFGAGFGRRLRSRVQAHTQNSNVNDNSNIQNQLQNHHGQIQSGNPYTNGQVQRRHTITNPSTNHSVSGSVPSGTARTLTISSNDENKSNPGIINATPSLPPLSTFPLPPGTVSISSRRGPGSSRVGSVSGTSSSATNSGNGGWWRNIKERARRRISGAGIDSTTS
jgi:hypothetical protein